MRVLLAGDISTTDGYSVLAANFVRTTKDRIEWFFDPLYDKRRNLALYRKCDIVVHHNPAIFFNPSKTAKINVLYTLWETSKATDEFLKRSSKADELWFHSEWSMKAFGEIDLPKRVVPPPIPIWFGTENTSKQTSFVSSPFRFLFVGAWYSRKGPDILLEAYAEEFDKSEDVELWLKRTYLSQNSTYPTLNEMIKQHKVTAPVVDVQKKYENMEELYKQCNCFVLPSRGEGYCLPAVEAGLCDLDIIVSRCSALEDVWSPVGVRFVEGKTKKVGDSWETEPGVVSWVDPESLWFEPDVDSLRKQMRKSFEEWSESLRSKILKQNNKGVPLIKALESLE